MRNRLILLIAVMLAIVVLCACAWANDPIKWSAPMSHYPRQWSPTPEPPNYYNPYGYSYPYYGYGYGPYNYYGYGSGGYMQGGQSVPGQTFSGNPYRYNY